MQNSFVTELITHMRRVCAHPDLDIDGATLAHLLERIADHEIEEGGPYAAIPGGTLRDADVGLNLVIALFLATHDVHLPKLDAFLHRKLSKKPVMSVVVDAETLACLIPIYRSNTKTAAPVPDTVVPLSESEQAVLMEIREQARVRFAPLSEAFADTALWVIDRTIRGNPDKQMSLMAAYVRDALGKKGEHFSDSYVAELGLANIFFWTAFIIYDDFWDEDEAAEPRLLPVANVFARHYTDFFSTLLSEESGFRAFFHKTMDMLDGANEWEMLECRMRREGEKVYLPERLPVYGDYDIKFYPAAGHIFGPVALLVELGYDLSSPEVEQFIAYAKHYLIAMQLNDDMHDWKEDLRRGHISTAVALLLTKWSATYPKKRFVHLVDDMEKLERLFWFEALPELCESVLARTKEARKALESLDFLEDLAPLERFIIKNERIATEALQEQKKSVEFLAGLKR